MGFGLSNNVLHFFLSATNSLHLLTPNTWRSLSTSSFQSNTAIFFFHWHYSPLWALACPTVPFHFSHLPPTLSIFSLPALEDLFLLPLSILSWVFPFFSSLPVLECRSFWASYPPLFSPGDLTSLSFAKGVTYWNHFQKQVLLFLAYVMRIYTQIIF